jgi:hypothetical protein
MLVSSTLRRKRAIRGIAGENLNDHISGCYFQDTKLRIILEKTKYKFYFFHIIL